MRIQKTTRAEEVKMKTWSEIQEQDKLEKIEKIDKLERELNEQKDAIMYDEGYFGDRIAELKEEIGELYKALRNLESIVNDMQTDMHEMRFRGR